MGVAVASEALRDVFGHTAASRTPNPVTETAR